MTEPAASGWNRRDFIGGAALLALALGVPIAAIRLSDLDPDQAPSERHRQLLREVSQLVLPRTGTPGAGDVGVGDFVILALAHGLEGTRAPGASAGMPQLSRHTRPDGSLRYIDWLESELDRRSNGDFLHRTSADRAATLAALDAEAYPPGPPPEHPSPWQKLKVLILTGYYTTEAGGAQELRYELVPGRWDPDLPLKPGDRAWSSDWTAVDFG